MRVTINEKEIMFEAIKNFQFTSDWDSIYSRGALVIDANALFADNLIADEYFFIGAPVEIFFTDSKVLFLSILSINFSQGNEVASNTFGDFLEISLVSRWKFDAEIKTKSK